MGAFYDESQRSKPESTARRLGRLGRIRAFLRLGEWADVRPPRCAVLAASGVVGGWTRARARLWNRPRVVAPRTFGRSSRRCRSVGGHARACRTESPLSPPGSNANGVPTAA